MKYEFVFVLQSRSTIIMRVTTRTIENFHQHFHCIIILRETMEQCSLICVLLAEVKLNMGFFET